ncbi:hypothetical protein C8J57DRAFT_1108823 [Mycena rebaudengoi]|nr:hypothetical protein C8J57DRAFT_1108823 [Mycena rebaudengoi]
MEALRHDVSAQNLTLLRTHWKWAAFSQFFFTFPHLFSMEDVSLNDIEDDLARETNLFLPRVMARLLYVLSYDRKVGLDNWQSALRRQHNRRDPASNPIGPEPRTDSGHPHYLYASVSVDNDTLAPADGEDNGMEQDSVAHSEADRTVFEEGNDSAPPRERTEGEESQNEAPDKVVKEEEQPQQETKDWLDLPMLTKLDSLYLLTEWQCQNPTRLRSLMKTDYEVATWRIGPIGYDAKSNAYWLIGADRLWIQRVQPKPPRYTATTSSLKRKRLPPTAASTSKAKRLAPKRARLADDAPASNGKLTITVPGGGRAAKKLKLEGQAQELAALNREAAAAAAAANKRKRGRTEVAAVRPLGTRLSARLRGADEEKWQPMPAAWLEDEGSKSGKNGGASGSKGKSAMAVKPPPKTGLESDDESVSELTELSEDPAEEENVKEEEAAEPAEAGVSVLAPAEEENVKEEEAAEPAEAGGFVEWETICITLYEWEHIAERFEKATHYTEKALYKTLVNNIVPIITEELREIERKKRLEEAIVHPKRSSRIANKESEKEEARAAARQRAEAQEKETRAQRLEARLAKEEADRERREAARELRRREKKKASKRDAPWKNINTIIEGKLYLSK